jgi:hypothetical protein
MVVVFIIDVAYCWTCSFFFLAICAFLISQLHLVRIDIIGISGVARPQAPGALAWGVEVKSLPLL